MTLHNLVQVSQYGSRAQRREGHCTLINFGPQDSFPTPFLASQDDKIYIHDFDYHLHAKNSNTYFYSRTLSSFSIQIYRHLHEWIRLQNE